MTAANATSPPVPLRMVLIEDCRLIRVGLHSVLDSSPYVAVVAEVDSAEEGLPLIRNLKPDVVMIDIGLPGMSGIEAIALLRREGNQCPVIVLTSHDDESDVVAAMAAGANAYCLKNRVSNRLIDIAQLVNEGSLYVDAPMGSAVKKAFLSQAQQTHDDTDEGIIACDVATRQIIKLPTDDVSLTAREKQEAEALRGYLSPREGQVLRLIVDGHSNAFIADTLFISIHTVKFYVSNVLDKLNVNDRVAAAVKAVRLGLL
jgi:DNA-binding NarL/FixJ family response regulator